MADIDRSGRDEKTRRMYRRMPWFYGVVAACLLITAIAGFSQAGTNRPLRYYTDDGSTAMTYYTNGSGNNTSFWGINTDNPRCEFDINGTVCINGSSHLVQGVAINGTLISADGNNYPTALSVNQTGSSYSVVLARSGLGSLMGNFSVSGTGGIGYVNTTGASFNSTNWFIRMINDTTAQAAGVSCNAGDAISTLSNNSVCTSFITPAALAAFGYISSAPNVNVTGFTGSGTTVQLNLSNGSILNATTTGGSGTGNISGNIAAGKGVYALNGTEIYYNDIYYVQPGNFSDIQTKLDLCGTNGCVVVVPPGQYSVNSTIIINKTHVSLIGEGLSTKLNVANNANLYSIITANDSSYGTIAGFYIYGNNDSQTGGTGYGIVVNRSARYRLQDLYITDTVNDSITLVGNASSSSTHAANIVNVRILNSGDEGLVLGAFAYDTEILNLWIGSSVSNGASILSGSQFFTNFHSWGNGGDGIFVRSTVNKFTNCYLETNSGDGLDAFGNDRQIITGCYIWSNGVKGLQLQTSNYNTISNNIIKDNTGQGISIDNTTSNIISGNMFDNNQYAIVADGANNSVINSNVFVFNTNALVARNLSNSSIIGNAEYSNNAKSIINGTDITVIGWNNLSSIIRNLNVSEKMYYNGSEVCTATNGVCGVASSSGNVTYSGNGTAGYIPRMTNNTNMNNSGVYDDGRNLTIGQNVTVSLTGVTPMLDVLNAAGGEAMRISRTTGSNYLTFFSPGGTGTPALIKAGSSTGTVNAIHIYTTNVAGTNISQGDVVIDNGNGGNTSAAFYVDVALNTVAVNTSNISLYPDVEFVVNGDANITGTTGIGGSLLVNGTNVCLQNGTNCPAGGAGNVTATNGTAGYVGVFSSASNLVAMLINSTMIGNAAVNVTHLYTSNGGSAGQVLTLNSTGGMNWSTPSTGSSSGGNASINGNGVFGTYTIQKNTTEIVSGNLTENGVLQYPNNATFSKYVSIGGTVFPYNQPRRFKIAELEFIRGGSNTGGIESLALSTFSSGASAAGTGDANHPGVLILQDSATALGGSGIYSDVSAFLLGGGENFTVIFQIRSGQTGNSTTKIGFHDVGGAGWATDGCYWSFDNWGTGTGGPTRQAEPKCASNNAQTKTTNFTYTNNTWYVGNIYVNPTATNVTFTIMNETGGVLQSDSITSNIPTAAGRETGAGVIFTQNTTSAAAPGVYLDYLSLVINRELNRGLQQ